MKPLNVIAPFTVMFLCTPARDEVLLLERSQKKKLFPGLYTGIGGHIDLQNGERGIWQAMQREWEEETHVPWSEIAHAELIAQVARRGEDESVLLFVFSGILEKEKMPLVCTEGNLRWVKKNDIMNLPLIPTSRLIVQNFFLEERKKKEREVHFAVVNKDYTKLFAFPQ